MDAAIPHAVEEQPLLRRAMGLSDVALFFIVSVSNLQWVALAAGAGPSAIIVWIIGCAVMFVPLSIVVVYMTSRHPDEGGMYVWTKIAFGPFVGFMTGWTYWISTLPFFAAVLYFAAGNALYVVGADPALGASPVYFVTFALLALAFATLLNVFGLGAGKWLNNVGSISRCLSFGIIVVLGALVWIKFGSVTHVDAMTLRPGLALKDVIFWSVIALALTGPECVPFMAAEIRDPRRSVPLGLAIAAPAIVAIYVLGTLALLVVLPPASISQASGVMQAISKASGELNLNALIPVSALLVSLSCVGSAGAWLSACARLPFVAGIDRFLPAAFGRIHPRWGSPVIALVTMAGFAALFVVLGLGGSSVKSAYNLLVEATVLTTMIPFVTMFASALKLCKGRILVRIAAVVGLATTLVAGVLSCFPANDDPDKTLAVLKLLLLTATVLGAGVAIYYGGRRRALAAFESSCS